MYDVWESTNISNNFSNPGHNIDELISGAIVVVEFQILLYNFKASQKVDAVNAYLFQLLGVYLIDDLINLTILTLNKC